MKEIKNYPRLTIILRGYSYEDALYLIKILADSKKNVGIEITSNTDNYLKIIKDASKEFGKKIMIGAGTILNLDQAKDAITNGAKFILSPVTLSKEVIDYAKEKGVYTVPGAMTPSEIYKMVLYGADIIKVFPFSSLKSNYVNQVMGPLDKLNIMAVGGVKKENLKEFLTCGASYVGVGSSMFNKEDVKNRSTEELLKSVDKMLDIINSYEESSL
ncbi:MAG: bifunctional 4-hydroxy-2-oxoglutarate aldolase/2-dehydro-3-deoxy-phosphogluconate aldolase [Anaerococcus vaginalis]|uniref:bifunctional 4-hydroxy-2-oxoglutarate aldolase/2-dehydro-3-deoxy-phosphogluconate aldolase n=1 Tax=Anaerococcus TaxID=165779 RepID=UPI00031534A1|nr:MULTISPECIES: bifunctional 4-hydroxy-2-oxoglutarate aldolase/2-dehydro-3-deoxy-phosphogluconate aldolase [Anaerococcus]MDU0945138.1 bifunctional 4-hydroxy-2-oxoglutarate aldolase/2-dehydro-3-deoxy-phosphogluconate aldolase [Anaerococcus vaginalis]MDU1029707.1 bifunctional 4-hydroxy-2-oxoglutarate aldolase/2-dehydro-3-deoxy-phosphogluconate aldolase [Anaerococcus vaginalis]MDU5085721.1 bifunctional 4-hydroxy-2-oxoglutarate aldolase/2-dehydro-3-deoxy-phosphogluconate aldolase [Anaerococcus vagi